MSQRPGRNFSQADLISTLHIFFLLDNSGSMDGKPLQTLNEAMENVLRALAAEAKKKGVRMKAHLLAFSSGVQWLCGSTAEKGVDIENVRWQNLDSESTTDTAAALMSLLPGLSTDLLGPRTFTPVVILISDGYSDNREATKEAIRQLTARQNVFRIAIGVDGYNCAEFNDFVSHGVVHTVDRLGNAKDSRLQGLIFPVHNAAQLAPVVANVSVCSMLSSLTAARQAASGADRGAEKIEILMPEDLSAPPRRRHVDLNDAGWLK